jgi:hypothetical protein
MDSISTSVKVDVDNLMEDIFCTEWTTLSNSKNFLHTNFCGRATHLTMLSLHHWPGMAFGFLLMLLTQSRKEICSSCFQGDDVKAKCYALDLAPGWFGHAEFVQATNIAPITACCTNSDKL